jgi:lysophospholipase L1-like esterase
VITSVAFDNFRPRWLDYYGGLELHLQYVLEARHLLQIDELKVADRLEYSLSTTPPREYHQTREQFTNGLEQWLRYAVRARTGVPRIRTRHPSEPFYYGRRAWDFREKARSKKLYQERADLELQAGQTNFDALGHWVAEVEALGAEPWLIHIPPSPEYYERFVIGDWVPDFHAAMADVSPRYVRLTHDSQAHYVDYDHPNYLGRRRLSAELAEVMAEAEPGSEWIPRPVDEPYHPGGAVWVRIPGTPAAAGRKDLEGGDVIAVQGESDLEPEFEPEGGQ